MCSWGTGYQKSSVSHLESHVPVKSQTKYDKKNGYVKLSYVKMYRPQRIKV